MSTVTVTHDVIALAEALAGQRLRPHLRRCFAETHAIRQENRDLGADRVTPRV